MNEYIPKNLSATLPKTNKIYRFETQTNPRLEKFVHTTRTRPKPEPKPEPVSNCGMSIFVICQLAAAGQISVPGK